MHITILRKDIGDFHLWNADFRLTGMVISNGRTGDGFHSGILIFEITILETSSNFIISNNAPLTLILFN